MNSSFFSNCTSTSTFSLLFISSSKSNIPNLSIGLSLVISFSLFIIIESIFSSNRASTKLFVISLFFALNKL